MRQVIHSVLVSLARDIARRWVQSRGAVAKGARSVCLVIVVAVGKRQVFVGILGGQDVLPIGGVSDHVGDLVQGSGRDVLLKPLNFL